MEEKLYFVRAVGKDVNTDSEAKAYEAAVQDLKELYASCMKGKKKDSFDEAMLEICAEDQLGAKRCQMTLIDTEGDGYFQCAYILPANKASGTAYLIEELLRAAETAATCANAYEYLQNNMNEVYGELNRIRDLANDLKRRIESPQFRQMIYLEESQKKLAAARRPVEVQIVVDEGRVTDVAVSSHLDASVLVEIIDLDTTDPIEQAVVDEALKSLQEEIAAGSMRQEY